MITPDEFRIGNMVSKAENYKEWINEGIDPFVKVFSISKTGINAIELFDEDMISEGKGMNSFVDELSFNQIFPIPLSMEILSQFYTFSQDIRSWEKDVLPYWCYIGGAESRFKLLLESHYEGGDGFYLSYGTSIGFECYELGFSIFYFHELQNLYYMLCHNGELKLKSNEE